MFDIVDFGSLFIADACVDERKPVPDAEHFIWDAEVPGFGLRVLDERAQELHRAIPRRAAVAAERMAVEQLGEPCARWLSTGERLN